MADEEGDIPSGEAVDGGEKERGGHGGAHPKDAFKPLVLIVDDDAVMLRTMVNTLKNDFRTRIAKSAVNALQVITNERPDLMLLDYMMPVADGVQTLRMIRAEPTMADIPVFFLTGVADSDVVAAAGAMNIEGYLLKSTAPKEILHRIKVWFIRHGGMAGTYGMDA